jgi:AbrB family looped-hinge helix DNA binding protein
MEQEKLEIAVLGTKGQIVIPQRLRKELALLPNTKLSVYRSDDKIVLVELKITTLADPKDLFKEIFVQNKGKKKVPEKKASEKKPRAQSKSRKKSK